jgi:hypothetical protein
MRQHIHYGDWTIEWSKSIEVYDLTIGNESCRTDWRCLEPLRLGVGSFALVEDGIDSCKKLIADIIVEQRQVAIRFEVRYAIDRDGSTASIEQVPSTEVEESDRVSS